MVSLQDIQGVWTKVEDCFKVITPKNDKIKELESKIRIPFHYVLMILTVVVGVLLSIFVKSLIFSNVTIFIVSFFACMKNLCSDKRDEKKWYSYWFLFVLNQFVPCLDMIHHVKIFKFFFLLYLALFDDCVWMNEIFEWLYTKSQYLFETYIEKFCKEHTKKD